MNPRRRDDVHAQALPDGSALLYDADLAMAYPITESASLVWNSCDGEHSLEEIVDVLEAAYDAPRETISADVDSLIEDLTSKELLRTSAA